MTNEITERKRYLDVEGVASYLELSKHTIRSWVKNRKIPFIKCGRAVRFNLDDIEKWMQAKRVSCLGNRYLSFCLSSFSHISFSCRYLPSENQEDESL